MRAPLSAPRRQMLVFACLLGTAACASSPPTHFLTLGVIAPRPGEAASAGTPVRLGKVVLPLELNRPQPVRHAGDHRLDVPSGVRWAAPLDELVHRTLALDLGTRLPEGEMVLPGQPDPSGPLRVLVVTFRTLSVDASSAVILDARWTAVDRTGGGIALTKDVRFVTPAKSGSWDDAAGALSTALGRLADRIASSLAAAGDDSGGVGG